MRLSNEYTLEYDENNVVLVFSEPRTRVKKNGTTEEYIYTDKYYYPNIKSALKSYLNKSIKGAKDIQDLVDKILNVEKKIDNLSEVKI